LGFVCIWARNISENWQPFAPDFEELAESVEYEEREDEFDSVRGISGSSVPEGE
jgi:hypothetical protein